METGGSGQFLGPGGADSLRHHGSMNGASPAQPSGVMGVAGNTQTPGERKRRGGNGDAEAHIGSP